MPLAEIKCANGHLTEVLMRGAAKAPLVCPTCGEEAERLLSTFAVRSGPESQREAPVRFGNRPQWLNRAGGGKAYLKDKLYYLALTHNAKCPQCARRRNVAITADLPWGKRCICEACGYTWIHQEETASDPMFEGVNDMYRPARHFSREVPSGTGYRPERGN